MGGGVGGGVGGGAGGGRESSCNDGFPKDVQFALKFENGRCLYPENDSVDPGTNIVAPSNVCRTELAKFIITDMRNLKHVQSDLCVQAQNSSPLILAKACSKEWAFSLKSTGSLQLESNGQCVQPTSGSTRPSETEYFVLLDTCDVPEANFTITGINY